MKCGSSIPKAWIYASRSVNASGKRTLGLGARAGFYTARSIGDRASGPTTIGTQTFSSLQVKLEREQRNWEAGEKEFLPSITDAPRP
jgi:hypothetical protein